MNNVRYESSLLFLLFIFLPLIYSTEFGRYSLLIFIGVLILFWVCNQNMRTKSRYIYVNSPNTLKWFLIFIIWNFFCSVSNFDFSIDSATRLIQLFGCLGMYIFASSYVWTTSSFRIVRNIIKIFILFILVHWLISGMPLNNYSFLFGNPNTCSSSLVCLIFFIMLEEKPAISDYIVALCSSFLLYCTSARAALLAVVVFFVVKFVELIRRKKVLELSYDKAMRKTIFFYVLFLALMICIIYTYCAIYRTAYGTALQDWSVNSFHKNFYSGRQILWSNLWNYIARHPIVGYGMSAVPENIISISKSTHNIFLQVALQSGLIGTGILICLLICILKEIIFSNNRFICGCIASVFAITLHECFEVCLTQNLLMVGMQMWFLMGIGCNLTFNAGEEIYGK